MKKEQKKVKGYKAFDKDFKCRGFQFEVGKTYEEKEASLCNKGFHFCENPLDVLNYYNLTDAKFALIEAEDVSDEKKDDDSKRVAKKIKIKTELDLPMFIKASFDFIWEQEARKLDKAKEIINKKTSGNSSQLASSGYSSQLASSGDYSKLASSGNSSKLASSGDYSQLASSGDYSKLASSGNYSKLASSGYSSQLASSGDYSIVAGIGIDNMAKGTIGNWIVLAEWVHDDKLSRLIPKDVQCVKVDGKKIKADTYYKLKKGKFVCAE